VGITGFKLTSCGPGARIKAKVVTRVWWRPGSRSRIVCKEGPYWYFQDTGKFTPSNIVECLYRSYKARNNLYSDSDIKRHIEENQW